MEGYTPAPAVVGGGTAAPIGEDHKNRQADRPCLMQEDRACLMRQTKACSVASKNACSCVTRNMPRASTQNCARASIKACSCVKQYCAHACRHVILARASNSTCSCGRLTVSSCAEHVLLMREITRARSCAKQKLIEPVKYHLTIGEDQQKRLMYHVAPCFDADGSDWFLVDAGGSDWLTQRLGRCGGVSCCASP